MPSQLKILEEQGEDAVTIRLFGEVDISTAQELKERLYSVVDEKKTNLRIDCSNLDYIDSMGLGVLVGVLKRVRQGGKNIYVSNLKEGIRKLFLITSLDKLFIME